MTLPDRVDPVAKLAEAGARLKAALEEAGRDGAVDIVAVTKTHNAERILPLLEAGHRRFGENRVQEAQSKWPSLKARYPGLALHLIGPLQTNKVADAVALFDVIETLDRPKLARALAAEMARSGRRPDLYVQVNTGEEPQKAGVPPTEADAFLAACREEFGLAPVGLMCIPPAEEPPAPHFALLAKIARRNGLEKLSMGMSGDYEIAAQLGATHVRIGSGLFGAREASHHDSPTS
jgi:hypothetical protein